MNEMEYRERLRAMGLKISYYRRRAGYTQEQLAELVGVSWSTVSKLETGITGGSLRVLWEIAEVCGMPMSKLFEEG